jgi:hypothetical protein
MILKLNFMKSLKKIALATIGLVLLSITRVSAQSPVNDYRFAIGIRAGETSGFTFNLNSVKPTGMEFIVGLWSNWVSLTALYEKRAPAFNTNGLKWYYGAGGHVAFATATYFQEGRTYPRGDNLGIGMDGVIGLEYKIPEIPFALNINLKPLIEINRVQNVFFGIDPAIGVKFTF